MPHPPDLAYDPPRPPTSTPSSSQPAPDVAPGLVSNAASYLRKKIARRSHRSGSVVYPQSFTVRDLRTTLEKYLRKYAAQTPTPALVDALVASLELQSYFYMGAWKNISLACEDDVCMFLYCGDEDIEPPTGVFPSVAKCYSPTCEEANPCYSPSCPYSVQRSRLPATPSTSPPTVAATAATVAVPAVASRCYSSDCQRGKGCYSPTCCARYAPVPDIAMSGIPYPCQDQTDTPKQFRPAPPRPPDLHVSSRVTHIEPIMIISIIGPSITWIDQYCRPLDFKARRPFSFYLKGLPGGGSSDICIGAEY